jgi:hypothetical protein
LACSCPVCVRVLPRCWLLEPPLGSAARQLAHSRLQLLGSIDAIMGLRRTSSSRYLKRCAMRWVRGNP